MDFVQKSNFFLSEFFTEIISEKIVFDIVERKEWYLDEKIEVLKRAKKWPFSKGVGPGILSKNLNFCYGCFLQELCQKKKSFFDSLDRKQSFLEPKIEVLTRARKWRFFKGVSPWILSKNWTFSYRRFSQKSYQKRSFFDVLERKQSFVDPKIQVLTRAKKWRFF